MVHCMNPSCRKEIGEGYAFCPFCGADNREPHLRTPVRCSVHERIEGARACIACGKPINEDGSAKLGAGYRIAGIVMIVVGICLAVLGAIWLVYDFKGPSRFGGRHMMWFEIATIAAGAYLVGHGWYWVRGVGTDFSLLDNIDPF